MSSLPPVQNGQPEQGIWPYIAPYVNSSIAASAAIVPVFYGFVGKSSLQTGKPLPNMLPKEIFIGGLKAAPTIGITIGSQMFVQNMAEEALITYFGYTKENLDFKAMLVSSIATGILSTPPLAMFNGQTMGRSVWLSLKSLSIKQTAAIVSRETSFLFSLRISDPISKAIKGIYGDNKIAEYGATFISGVALSVVGHPADTALTLWQKDLKVENPQQLMRGVFTRALAIGGFSILYKAAKETLKSLS